MIVAPVTITGYAVYLIFRFTDGILNPYIEKYFDFSIPGLGIVVAFIFLSLLGFIGSTVIARPFKILFSKILERTPFVKLIYSSLKDLLSAFVGQEKKFNRPVLVQVNTISNLEKLGFITQEDLSDLNVKDKVAVYFPHSYNFSGELFIVPTENIKKVDIAPSEAMKFIVSGGITKV